MKHKYQWANEHFHSGQDPNAIGRELDALRDESGTLDVHDALEWAQEHKESALYDSLEQDGRKAAHEWRLHQLRIIIASIRRVEVSGGEVHLKRAHFSVGGGRFASPEAVEEDEELQGVVLEKALRSLEGWSNRYSEIIEMCGGAPAAKRLLKALKSVA